MFVKHLEVWAKFFKVFSFSNEPTIFDYLELSWMSKRERDREAETSEIEAVKIFFVRWRRQCAIDFRLVSLGPEMRWNEMLISQKYLLSLTHTFSTRSFGVSLFTCPLYLHLKASFNGHGCHQLFFFFIRDLFQRDNLLYFSIILRGPIRPSNYFSLSLSHSFFLFTWQR